MKLSLLFVLLVSPAFAQEFGAVQNERKQTCEVKTTRLYTTSFDRYYAGSVMVGTRPSSTIPRLICAYLEASCPTAFNREAQTIETDSDAGADR